MQHLQHAVSWIMEGDKSAGGSLGLIEGFSGVGKSTAVTQAVKAWTGVSALVNVTEGARFEDVLFDVASELDGQGLGASHNFDDFAAGLMSVLKKEQALIVLDDVDNLQGQDGGISAQIRQLALEVNKTPAKGRLILVSSTGFADSDWGLGLPTFTLKAPEEPAAVAYLNSLLSNRRLEHEVPEHAKIQVVNWLGRNPNAMQAFVSCLVGESFDDLIDTASEDWALAYTEPSDGLLLRLQKTFWVKTLGRLSAQAQSLAGSCSVLRRPFRKEAMAAVGGNTLTWEKAKSELTSNFILERQLNNYHLNPVVKKLLLADLRKDERRYYGAQLRAGHFYRTRSGAHGTGTVLRVGAAFVEAKHHLTSAGQEAEVEVLSREHRGALLASLRGLRVDFADARRVVELTPVLLGVLDKDDADHAALREVLVRLLRVRNYEGDERLALRHASIASRSSKSYKLWFDFAELALKLESVLYVARLAERARGLNSKDLSAIVRQIALGLHRQGDSQAAARVAREAQVHVADSEKVYLYSTLAYISDASGARGEAIRLLRDGFAALVPGTRGRERLFEEACFMALRESNKATLQDLRSDAIRLEGGEELANLAAMLTSMSDGRYEEALGYWTENAQRAATRAQAVFCHLVLGQPLRAQEVLRGLPLHSNKSNAWLAAVVSLCCRDADAYAISISKAFAGVVSDEELADPILWVRVWQRQPESQEPYPGFYFPRLPMQLTGLRVDLEAADSAVGDIHGLEGVQLPIVSEFGVQTHETQAAVDPFGPDGPRIVVYAQEANMSKYVNNGNSGAMGDGATNYGPVGDAGSVADLTAAIDDLLLHTKISGTNAANPEVVSSLEDAKTALESNDQVTALTKLRTTSAWLGDKLSNVAVGASAGIVLRSLGY